MTPPCVPSNQSIHPRAMVTALVLGIFGGFLWSGRASFSDETLEPLTTEESPYSAWKNGPPTDPTFFPIAVWLQAPKNAPKYCDAGINTYVGLWRGPTEEQLAELKATGMKVICDQNEVGLQHKDDPTIIAWMHGDEPDNAQSLGSGKGYGPPILPGRIVDDYRRIQGNDPTRPVFLNLGQGVAWDDYIGRGVRRNHPEDYPEYIQGCDIASFDIYPAVHDKPEIAGNLEYVARGVQRLVEWGQGQKIVWNCLECSRISNRNRKPTPQEIEAEAWMSIIHGSRGLIYFVHQFEPRFVEASVLDDPELLPAVTALNHRIIRLAPVLNSPTVVGELESTSTTPEVPVAALHKRWSGADYILAVAMRGQTTTGSFQLTGLPDSVEVEVLDENRQIQVRDGAFQDEFGPWQVHIYRIRRE